jgi:hypothetical protein
VKNYPTLVQISFEKVDSTSSSLNLKPRKSVGWNLNERKLNQTLSTKWILKSKESEKTHYKN